MSYNKKRCIVRDSKNSFYEFYIYNKSLVLENNNLGQRVLKEDILDYALDIDNNDKIHIVYLNTEGELLYIVYDSNMRENNIFSVNDKYVLKELNLRIINSVIHIFYQVDNFKGDISSIYHNYLIEGNWIDEKLTETHCPRYVCSYFIDCYKSDIYILYCWDYDLGEYNIKKLDTKKNIWEDFENGIIIKDSSSLNFFITPNYVGIICFSKFIGNNIQTFVKHRDFSNPSAKWSSDINVSNNNTNTLRPIAFYKDNYIYVTWKQDNKIIYKKSNDISNWSRELMLDIKSENIYSLMYLSNYEYANMKINYVYIPYIEFLYSLINPKLEYAYNSLAIDNVNNKLSPVTDINLSNESISSLQKKHSEIIEEKNNYIRTLIHEIEARDLEIASLKETNLKSTNQINYFNNLIKEYESKLEHIKSEQILNDQKYFRAISYYENEIKKLKEEKERLLEDINNKVQNLLKIIEEKNGIIQKLLKK